MSKEESAEKLMAPAEAQAGTQQGAGMLMQRTQERHKRGKCK